MPNEEYDHLLKLLLVGDTAVGKSSLLLRFTDGELSQCLNDCNKRDYSFAHSYHKFVPYITIFIIN